MIKKKLWLLTVVVSLTTINHYSWLSTWSNLWLSRMNEAAATAARPVTTRHQLVTFVSLDVPEAMNDTVVGPRRNQIHLIKKSLNDVT